MASNTYFMEKHASHPDALNAIRDEPLLNSSFPAFGTEPPPYTAMGPEAAAQEAALLEETTAWIPKTLVTSEVRAIALTKPIVIPRIDTVGRLTVPLPFMRAYSPDLRPHDIDEKEFVAFIDNLAVAQAAPAPLQVMNLTGTAIGFVPHHWFQLAGAATSVAAGAGTAAFIAVRTRRFMEQVNQEYFAPRGLKVSFCKNKDLAEKIGLEPNLPALAPLDLSSEYTSIRDRRMQALAPYIAPLSLDVPPPSEAQRNFIDKMSAKQIEWKRQKKSKKERKEIDKMRRKQAKQNGMRQDPDRSQDLYGISSSSSSSSNSSSDSSLDDQKARAQDDKKIDKTNRKAEREMASKGYKDPKEAAKIEKERMKEIHKIEKERSKKDREREKELAKKTHKKEKKMDERNHEMEKKVRKKTNKDEKAAARMEFIVIEKLEAV